MVVAAVVAMRVYAVQQKLVLWPAGDVAFKPSFSMSSLCCVLVTLSIQLQLTVVRLILTVVLADVWLCVKKSKGSLSFLCASLQLC